MTDNKKHVALLMGGLSSEREVSLTSGQEVEKALKKIGYKVTIIDAGQNTAQDLIKAKPDVAFNSLHGTYGEDGCIPGLLEILAIPYTHSGVKTSAVAMDKQLTKYILQTNGINCAPGEIYSAQDIASGNINIAKPFVIKPVEEGSSVGIYIIKEGDNSLPTLQELQKFKQLMVEKYIPGRELSVAVLDDKPLGVVEIRPKDGFYDYTNKYTDGKTDHLMPAPIDKNIYDLAMNIALKAHNILGCAEVSRTDFIFDEQGDGKLYFLEINTHPGLTPLSLVPEIALHAGIDFEQLVDHLVKSAKCEK